MVLQVCVHGYNIRFCCINEQIDHCAAAIAVDTVSTLLLMLLLLSIKAPYYTAAAAGCTATAFVSFASV
jgi:hypothetical protein